MSANPCVNVRVVVRLAFLGIGIEVYQMWGREMEGWITECPLHHENHFEVSPLDSEQCVAHPI